jgi:hypothetical protein
MKHIFHPILFLLLGIFIGFYSRGIISPIKPTSSYQSAAEQKSDGMPVVHHSVQTDNQSFRGVTSRVNVGGSSVSEIQAALERLKDIADLNERSDVRKALLQRWAELDGRGAFEYVNSMDEGEIKVQAMAVVAAELVHSDPQFLAEQTLAMPSNRSSRELVQDLANSWAQTDAQSALSWADQLPDGLGRKDALATICQQLGKQNPQEVSEQISQLPAGDFRNSLISNLAAQWGLSNPTGAVDWANTLPDSEKALAMSNLVGAWAQHNPTAAGTFAMQLPPGEMQNQAVMSAVVGWANQDPSSAAAWVLQIPDDSLREQGIQEIVGAWTGSDSDGAINWAKGLPEGTTRDVALNDLVASVAYWSPNKAAEIVPLIVDQTKQEQSMEVIMRSWSQTDPASAQNWLAKLNVAEGLKARLQSFLPGN